MASRDAVSESFWWSCLLVMLLHVQPLCVPPMVRMAVAASDAHLEGPRPNRCMSFAANSMSAKDIGIESKNVLQAFRKVMVWHGRC